MAEPAVVENWIDLERMYSGRSTASSQLEGMFEPQGPTPIPARQHNFLRDTNTSGLSTVFPILTVATVAIE